MLLVRGFCAVKAFCLVAETGPGAEEFSKGVCAFILGKRYVKRGPCRGFTLSLCVFCRKLNTPALDHGSPDPAWTPELTRDGWAVCGGCAD